MSMLPPQAFMEELTAAGIPLATLNMRRGVPDPRAIFKLVKILRQWQPAILTSFMFHANLLGRIAGRIAGVPVIISSIRNENFGGPRRDKILRYTDWMGNISTTNSRLAAESLIKRGVVPADKMQVIPNGLVLDRFYIDLKERIKLRQQLGISYNEFLWLAVGRLEEQKDYPTLLDAFRILILKNVRVQLRIAGQGPLLEVLKRQAVDSGLSDRIVFLGLRRDIPSLLNAADGFVLSSAWEGLPNVVMEAMAACKPVVATNVGGVPELVEDGVSGYIVPPHDPEALAAAMLKIMSLSEDERRAMGRAGRAHIEAKYSLDQVVDRWEKLYQDLLRNKGVSRSR